MKATELRRNAMKVLETRKKLRDEHKEYDMARVHNDYISSCIYFMRVIGMISYKEEMKLEKEYVKSSSELFEKYN